MSKYLPQNKTTGAECNIVLLQNNTGSFRNSSASRQVGKIIQRGFSRKLILQNGLWKNKVWEAGYAGLLAQALL
jgi:hypothetical protein